MKARFSLKPSDLLLQAKPGDLFVPVGPDLVECVCARAVDFVMSNESEPPVDSSVNVVVIACRVEPGEPEYFQPGYTSRMPAPTPVVFVVPLSHTEFVSR